MLGRCQAVLLRCLYCVACASALVLASEPAEARRCPVFNGWTSCTPAEQEQARAEEQAEQQREAKAITDQGLNEPPDDEISSTAARKTPSASSPEKAEPSAPDDYRPSEQQFVPDDEVATSREIYVGDPEAERLARIRSAEFSKSVDEFFSSVRRWVKIMGPIYLLDPI